MVVETRVFCNGEAERAITVTAEVTKVVCIAVLATVVVARIT